MSPTDRERPPDEPAREGVHEDRTRLWPRSAFLLVAFLAILAAGVVTVLLPELASDEGEDEGAGRTAAPDDER